MKVALAVVIVLGCTDDGGGQATGLATVKVVAAGKPVASAIVTADGNTVLTDSSGIANIRVARGSTIIEGYRYYVTGPGVPPVPYGSVSIVLGAMPGDSITLGSRDPARQSPVVGTINVAAPAVAGATTYQISLGTDGGNGSAPSPDMLTGIPVRAGGVTDGQIGVLAFAIGSDAQHPLAAAFVTAPFVDGGTVTIPAWSTPSPFEVDLMNAPNSCIPMDVRPSTGTRDYDVPTFGRMCDLSSIAFPGAPPGTLPDTFVSAQLDERDPVDDTLNRQWFWEWRGMLPSPFPIDFSSRPAIAQSPQVMPGSGGTTVGWQASGSMAQVKGVRVSLVWQAANNTLVYCDITSPATTSLTVPNLPDSLADLRPVGSVNVIEIRFVQSDALASYDDYRPIAYDPILLQAPGPFAVVITAYTRL